MRFNSPVAKASDKPCIQKGPYILRTLLADLPLSAEGDSGDVHITCVEFLDRNLYVGTSASEVLHYVQIPPDAEDPTRSPSYILASRLPPAFHDAYAPPRPGIQQILLLPTVNKACILCNWTVTFYSLPELSPAFGTTQIRPCNWIGGIDLNLDPKQQTIDGQPPFITVLASLNKKIRIIRISEHPRGLKTIDFAGSLKSMRRDSFACVADAQSYALLDVDRLLKIPLFTISSTDDVQATTAKSLTEDLPFNKDVKDASTDEYSAQLESSGRSIEQENRQGTGFDYFKAKTLEFISPETPSLPIESNPQPSHSENKNLKNPLNVNPEVMKQSTKSATHSSSLALLKPHILSPTPQEFLLVTGTGPNDPGVGMFVNLEGDPTRSTIEFARYPNEIVVDGRGIGAGQSSLTGDFNSDDHDDDQEGFVLASMTCDNDDKLYGIEIQRWDLDPAERENDKHWLEIPIESVKKKEAPKIGLGSVLDAGVIYFSDVIQKMTLERFHPAKFKQILDCSYTLSLRMEKQDLIPQHNPGTKKEEHTDQRYETEYRFIERLASVKTRIVAWSDNTIWWAVKNPLILRIDASISEFTNFTKNISAQSPLGRQQLISIVNSFCSKEAKTEAEYLSLGYIKQRAGLSLFLDGLQETSEPLSDSEYCIVEDALVEGSLDPRVILAIIPYLRNEIFEDNSGIWVQGGILKIANQFIANTTSNDSYISNVTLNSNQTLNFLRKYLTAWRKKKGFGSIANEVEIFKSVDAALLIVLLRLDKIPNLDSQDLRTVKTELYELVDRGVDCFDRAIQLLESHHRLYVLSRLYQSRKMTDKVLATWQRILEGDLDEGGEFIDGDQKVQEYLLKIRNVSLIQEYGVWLASRSPRLGVKVFAEDRHQIRFEPKHIVHLLRIGAPGAVKEYLEYLVFHKNNFEYVNELIVYYLDLIIKKLEESEDTKILLAQSYETYRASRPPKPTYRQFLAENMIDEEWWHSRLRLLQLLGGSVDLASSYDAEYVQSRIALFTQYLIPEVIILDGRQGHHEKALQGLIHGLGDYDTAINYCLLGGSSIYHPIFGTMSRDHCPSREQQVMLFGFLLSEFLLLDDVSNRVEQTCNLLERFGGWFDIQHVLNLIPDSWSIDIVSKFLLNSLRRTTRERGETMITKALSGAENLKVNVERNDKIIAAGPSVQG